MSVDEKPKRFNSDVDYDSRTPVHVVWELTLACNLRCVHCGSRAGKRRSSELNTEECLRVVSELSCLGTREITLIGGEAYLRNDWLEIVRAIKKCGMDCSLQTGGRHLSKQHISEAAKAGLCQIGVSIDGTAKTHDRLRGVPGSFDEAISVLRDSHDSGLHTSVNTAISKHNVDELDDLLEVMGETKASHWQLQLVVPMGNAVDNESLIIQPYELCSLMDNIARLYRRGVELGVCVVASNTIGYFGPYEHLLRGGGRSEVHWRGCTAGRTVIGIESDGTLKSCPSLPKDTFGWGNVRDKGVGVLWEDEGAKSLQILPLNRKQGICGHCYYSEVCRAGCTWMSHAVTGGVNDNPYCHYRALELNKRGYREKVTRVSEAPNIPFAEGKYEVVIESIRNGERVTSDEKDAVLLWFGGVGAKARAESNCADMANQVLVDSPPPYLRLCNACSCYIYDFETQCPHCHASVSEASKSLRDVNQRKFEVVTKLEVLLEAIENTSRELNNW